METIIKRRKIRGDWIRKERRIINKRRKQKQKKIKTLLGEEEKKRRREVMRIKDTKRNKEMIKKK